MEKSISKYRVNSVKNLEFNWRNMTLKINLKNKFNGMVSIAWLDMQKTCERIGDVSGIQDTPDIKFATDCFISMVGGEYDFYGLETV